MRFHAMLLDSAILGSCHAIWLYAMLPDLILCYSVFLCSATLFLCYGSRFSMLRHHFPPPMCYLAVVSHRVHSLVSSNHPRFLWFPSPENRTISELYTIFSFPISHLVHWSHYWSRRIPLHLGHLCFTIYNLPPGSQASIRDVAEVYRTIPSPQVNGLDLLSCGSEEILYCINTNSNFGLASAGGIYGKLVTLVQIFSALTESLLYRNGSTTTFSFEFYSSILALTTFGVLPSMISQKVVVRSLEATFGIHARRPSSRVRRRCLSMTLNY